MVDCFHVAVAVLVLVSVSSTFAAYSPLNAASPKQAAQPAAHAVSVAASVPGDTLLAVIDQGNELASVPEAVWR